MGMKQLTLPGEIVKKSNKLIRSKIIISSTQASRILASLIACIHQEDKEFKEFYSLPIKNFMGYNSGQGYKYIKNACKDLLAAHVELEQQNTDSKNKKPTLRLIPFFKEIEYRNGVVSAQFNSNLNDVLLQLQECFTQYNLLEYLTLPSIYSQRIFEILKSWAGLPEATVPLDELHCMLDAPPSFRADFKAFRLRVLEKAHKDINAKTELSYEWEAIKQGRAVTAIRFIFAKNRSVELKNKKEIEDQRKTSAKNNKIFVQASLCAQSKVPCVPKQNDVCAVCKRFEMRK